MYYCEHTLTPFNISCVIFRLYDCFYVIANMCMFYSYWSMHMAKIQDKTLNCPRCWGCPRYQNRFWSYTVILCTKEKFNQGGKWQMRTNNTVQFKQLIRSILCIFSANPSLFSTELPSFFVYTYAYLFIWSLLFSLALAIGSVM